MLFIKKVTKPKENLSFPEKKQQKLRKTNAFHKKNNETYGKPIFFTKKATKPKENQCFSQKKQRNLRKTNVFH